MGHSGEPRLPQESWSRPRASSTVSVSVGDMAHAYVTSKHAIVGLSKNMCIELGQHGIRVNCISPYGVVTEMVLEVLAGDGSAKKLQDMFVASGNLKEVVLEGKDVAEAALYLASDDSK